MGSKRSTFPHLLCTTDACAGMCACILCKRRRRFVLTQRSMRSLTEPSAPPPPLAPCQTHGATHGRAGMCAKPALTFSSHSGVRSLQWACRMSVSGADSCSPEAGRGAAPHQAHSESERQPDLKQVQQLPLPQLPRKSRPLAVDVEAFEKGFHCPQRQLHKLLLTLSRPDCRASRISDYLKYRNSRC